MKVHKKIILTAFLLFWRFDVANGEPVTMTIATVGAVGVISAFLAGGRCFFQECCSNGWISTNFTGSSTLKGFLQTDFISQLPHFFSPSLCKVTVCRFVHFEFSGLGPVVQSIVSLTSSLSTALQKLLTCFQQKILTNLRYYRSKF